jgi:HSP20 family molecular chaperone IbpA
MLTKYYDSMLKPSVDLFDPFRVFDDIYFASKPRTYTQSSAYRTETTEDGMNLSVDLPGVKSTDLTVHATGRDVKITGKLRGEEFSHTYRVSKDYDVENPDAVLEDGVLTIRFKKSSSAKTKVIEVRSK